MKEKDIGEELGAYETWCLEDFLQWLQVERQQMINLRFARPSFFGEGELAALNRTIAKLNQIITERNDYQKNSGMI